MRLCSCVCTEWNTLISECKRLTVKRDRFNPYEKANLLHTFGSKCSADGQFMYLLGVIALPGKILVCDHVNGRIQLFDQSGKFISKSGSGRLSTPHRGFIIKDSVWIADRLRHVIHVLNSDTLDIIRSISLGIFYPLAICCTSSNDSIFVTTDENIVLILNQEGSIIKQFGSFGNGNGQFRNARGICCNSRNEILITDSDNDRIQIFSQEGTFLRTFGSKGQGPNQFNFPHKISTDQEDNIFVADYMNDRISIFDRDGTPIQSVSVNGPHDLCLTERRMIVTTGGHSVVTFINYIFFRQ